MIQSWWRKRGKSRAKLYPHNGRPWAATFRPRLEPLEDRALPSVSYHGGNVLTHVQVETLYYGAAWQTNSSLQQDTQQLDGFFRSITNSSYMDMLSEYYEALGFGTVFHVGRGSFLDHRFYNANLGNETFDATIQQVLTAGVNGGGLTPPNDWETLYVVFTPPGVANDACLKHNWIGYHSSFPDEYTPGHVHQINYAVIPYPTDLTNAFAWQTLVSSHELAEAVTDPDAIFSTPNGVGVGDGWTDPHGSEIGDLAAGPNLRYGRLNGYIVQAEWSNQAFQRSNQTEGRALPPDATLLYSQGVGDGSGISGGADQEGGIDLKVPVANPDSYVVPLGAGLNVPAPAGVLANDSDPYGVTGQAVLDRAPAHGGVTLHADGSFTYSPGPDFSGTDTFSYHVNDGIAQSNTAPVRLAVGDPSVLVAGVAPFQPLPASGSDLQGLVSGPDGNVWFTELSANKIGRLAPDGTLAEFPVPTPASRPQDITVGPDGNLWFTESAFGVDKIGRITPAGKVTEFRLPLPKSQSYNGPYGITAGPDGNLWFTEEISDAIGRITPDGTVTEFPLGNFNTPGAITAGPDGNLWFLEPAAVGRITPTGAITEFPLAGGLSGPYGITAGPDGNLWFTQYFSGKIGRITPGGAVTEYVLPSSGNGGGPAPSPEAITTGPDGDLWFTDASNKVGRITLAGVVSEFALGAHQAAPANLVTGPDGNLWFSQSSSSGANQLNRLVTGGKALAATQGTAFNGTLATFFRAGAATAAGYAATIDWGDGTTSAGTFTADPAGGFDVSGSHTYGLTGTQTARVTITSNGTAAAKAKDSVTVQPAPRPTGLSLSNSSALEFRPVGTAVGAFSSTEAGSGHTFTYSLVSGAGSTDNGSFTVSGNQLLTADAFDSAARPSYAVRVRTTDEKGQFFEQPFTVTVTHDPALTRTGRTLAVSGTSGNDVFSFSPGAVRHSLTLNGVNLAVDAASVDLVSFSGDGGSDSVSLFAAGSGNIASLLPGAASLRGSGYSVTAGGVAQVNVFGAAGDSAYFTDPAGAANTFLATPTYAYLSGAGATEVASGFGTVHATSPGGGDRAYLYDSAGGAVFLGTSTYAYLAGPGFTNVVSGFPTVIATASSGADSAYLYGATAGGSVFVGTPAYGYLYGGGYFDDAVGFQRVIATAGASSDLAYLYGAPDNVLQATSSYAYLYGGGYFNDAVGFHSVYGYSGGGQANLYGTMTSADTFVNAGGYAYLYGDAFFELASGFASVWANPNARR